MQNSLKTHPYVIAINNIVCEHLSKQLKNLQVDLGQLRLITTWLRPISARVVLRDVHDVT